MWGRDRSFSHSEKGTVRRLQSVCKARMVTFGALFCVGMEMRSHLSVWTRQPVLQARKAMQKEQDFCLHLKARRKLQSAILFPFTPYLPPGYFTFFSSLSYALGIEVIFSCSGQVYTEEEYVTHPRGFPESSCTSGQAPHSAFSLEASCSKQRRERAMALFTHHFISNFRLPCSLPGLGWLCGRGQPCALVLSGLPVVGFRAASRLRSPWNCCRETTDLRRNIGQELCGYRCRSLKEREALLKASKCFVVPWWLQIAPVKTPFFQVSKSYTACFHGVITHSRLPSAGLRAVEGTVQSQINPLVLYFNSSTLLLWEYSLFKHFLKCCLSAQNKMFISLPLAWFDLAILLSFRLSISKAVYFFLYASIKLLMRSNSLCFGQSWIYICSASVHVSACNRQVIHCCFYWATWSAVINGLGDM